MSYRDESLRLSSHLKQTAECHGTLNNAKRYKQKETTSAFGLTWRSRVYNKKHSKGWGISERDVFEFIKQSSMKQMEDFVLIFEVNPK